MIEHGIVKFYKAAKNYGFVTVLDANGGLTSEELHFRHRDGHFMRANNGQPYFWLRSGKWNDGRMMKMSLPDKGNRVVFVRGSGPRGDKIKQWSYASDYESLIQQITGRPTYRLVRFGQDGFKVLWQGQDVAELSAEHPKYLRNDTSLDSITTGSCGAGDAYYSHRFEQLVGDDWRRCEDPRIFLCCLPLRTQNSIMTRGGGVLHFDRRCVHS